MCSNIAGMKQIKKIVWFCFFSLFSSSLLFQGLAFSKIKPTDKKSNKNDLKEKSGKKDKKTKGSCAHSVSSQKQVLFSPVDSSLFLLYEKENDNFNYLTLCRTNYSKENATDHFVDRLAIRNQSIDSFSFSPDGRYILFATKSSLEQLNDWKISIFETRTGKKAFEQEIKPSTDFEKIVAISFGNQEGTELFLARMWVDQIVAIDKFYWQKNEAVPIYYFITGSQGSSFKNGMMLLSPDGKKLFYHGDNSFLIDLTAKDKQVVHEITVKRRGQNNPNQVAFSLDSQYLITSTNNPNSEEQKNIALVFSLQDILNKSKKLEKVYTVYGTDGADGKGNIAPYKAYLQAAYKILDANAKKQVRTSPTIFHQHSEQSAFATVPKSNGSFLPEAFASSTDYYVLAGLALEGKGEGSVPQVRLIKKQQLKEKQPLLLQVVPIKDLEGITSLSIAPDGDHILVAGMGKGSSPSFQLISINEIEKLKSKEQEEK